MKLCVKLILPATTLVFLTSSAFAQNSPTIKKNDVYVSVDVGYGSLDTPRNDFPSEVSYSRGSAAAGVNVGFTHLIQRNINSLLLGMELGAAYNGQSKYSENFNGDSASMEIASYDVHLLGTATYLFANGLNFFAKAGPARVKQELDFSSGDDTDQTEETSKTQYRPMVAAGLGYQVKNFNFYFQYSHIFGTDAQQWMDLFNSDGTFANIVNVNTFKAGIAIHVAV